jgi:hypothetical protein
MKLGDFKEHLWRLAGSASFDEWGKTHPKKARRSAITSRTVPMPGGQCVPANEIMQPSG